MSRETDRMWTERQTVSGQRDRQKGIDRGRRKLGLPHTQKKTLSFKRTEIQTDRMQKTRDK